MRKIFVLILLLLCSNAYAQFGSDILSTTCNGLYLKCTDVSLGWCNYTCESVAASSPGWTDNGAEVDLTTSTDDVEIGSASTLGAKLAINGDSDEVQLLIQENATQTISGLIYETSGGVDLIAFEAGGDLEIGSAGSLSASLGVNGTSDQIQLQVQANATQTTNGIVYESSAGTDLFAVEGDGDVEVGTSGALTAKLAVNGIADETQFYVQGNSTQGIGNYLALIETSAGTDVLRVSTAGTLIGGTNAATISEVLSGTATIDFADPGTNNCTTASTVTVTGAAAGDPCFLGTAVAITDIWFECQITAANTCSVRACKVGNVAEDPASGSYRCVVMAF